MSIRKLPIKMMDGGMTFSDVARSSGSLEIEIGGGGFGGLPGGTFGDIGGVLGWGTKRLSVCEHRSRRS